MLPSLNLSSISSATPLIRSASAPSTSLPRDASVWSCLTVTIPFAVFPWLALLTTRASGIVLFPGTDRRLPPLSLDVAPVETDRPDRPVAGAPFSERRPGAASLAVEGGGLRAIVEAICLDQSVGGGTLQAKIDDLVGKGLLAKPQAELLHEERYIGNAALHEMLSPSKRDVEDGLAIVEGLMNTIYTLPLRAARLREKREKRTKS